MLATDCGSFTDKYRGERTACDRELQGSLTRLGDTICDPVVKLRFLREVLENPPVVRVVRNLPGAAARRTFYRWHGLAALERISAKRVHAIGVLRHAISSVHAALHRSWLRARQGALAIVAGFAPVKTSPRSFARVAGALLLAPLVIAGVAFGIGSKPTRNEAPAAAPLSTVETAAPRAMLPPVVEPIEVEDRSQRPATIWLADRGSGWELYSNGLRIETQHTVHGERRDYRIHHRLSGLQVTRYARPAGILFHITESDLWPLEPGYGRQLRRSTSGLIRYVKDNSSYNYLIDRFGRVYRIVEDDSAARHAGHSIWARGDEVYLDLNRAFLGIAFESRRQDGEALPITAAQLHAGRNLTDYLRQRFSIAPEMCVTHGLTSVSPRQHLIGYHLDWARGFPFAAFGLPDLYAEPTPSVALFGFGHDQRFLRDVGERWPGLDAAEDALSQRAADRGMSVTELREEGRVTYRRWAQEVRPDVSVNQQSADKRG